MLPYFWICRAGINQEVPKALKTLGFGDFLSRFEAMPLPEHLRQPSS